MLEELEGSLVQVLRESLEDVPKANIVVGSEPTKFPGLAITNLGFEFGSQGLAENVERERPEVEDLFSGNGAKKNFKLKESPLRGSVVVEHAPGSALEEGSDYQIDYDADEVIFSSPPDKGRKNVSVRYLSRRALITLKVLKLKANYSIDVYSPKRSGADSLAEKVVMALLSSENVLVSRGIELNPLGGEIQTRENGKLTVLRLKYVLQRELRLEKEVDLIRRIEVSNVARKRPTKS